MVGEGGQIAKGVEQDKERLSRLPSFDGAQALEGPAVILPCWSTEWICRARSSTALGR